MPSYRQILIARGRGAADELGLKEHLTPQRSNGFAGMMEWIRSDARAMAAPRPVFVRHAVSRTLCSGTGRSGRSPRQHLARHANRGRRATANTGLDSDGCPCSRMVANLDA